MDILQIYNLCKTYDSNAAASLIDIHLSLPNPQIFGLAGSSGSGKSTLLRLIAGLEEPDSGQILLDGQGVLPPSHKLIAGHEFICLLNQESELRPNLTISENLDYALRRYSPDYKFERINELLELCQLQAHAHKTTGQISGGQRQRAAWAVALATKPKILLLDEPFSHADPQLSRRLRNILSEIIQQNPCLIIVASHEPDNLFAICSQIMMLDNGTNLQTDTPTQLYNHPASAQIAAWAGPLNLLTAAQMSFLGFANLDDARIYGLRSCYITTALCGPEQHPSGYVLKTEFQGPYWLLYIRLSDDPDTLILSESPLSYPKNSAVNLSVLAERVMNWTVL